MGVWHRNKIDALSIKKWTFKNKDLIFFSQEKNDVVGYPFTLGIEMQWQFDVMLKWNNNRTISINATFGTNHIKYHLLIFGMEC